MKDSKYKCYEYREDKRKRKTTRRWRMEHKGFREPGQTDSRQSIGSEDIHNQKLNKAQIRNLNDHRIHWYPGSKKLSIEEGLLHWVRRTAGLPTFPDNEVQVLLQLQ